MVTRQFQLVEKVLAYDPGADEELLNKAYVFSMQAHGTQKRASGDPYFSHPVEVAGILADMKLDAATIVTALLHDTLEDTLATPEEIERNFGPGVLRLVDGVTKLSRIELQSDRARQAENFRKLLLAMSEDLRVLLVKLADRLHNMRTLSGLADADKRKRIAAETMEIYAPLAERIGMQDMKEELEDLAFAELYPDARASIVNRLEYLRDQGSDMVRRIADAIKRKLSESGIEAWVFGREKRPYSIWRKMQRRDVSFEQLSDIIAFRMVVADIGACYQALGVVHAAWPMVPGRFKDYISTPKPNNYRSLHTTVMGPEQQRVEIQIRTQGMQEVAEIGVAAHWAYKQATTPADSESYRWLRELLDILEHASDPEEFLENTKLSMFQDQVFCFTPKGDLIALPRGATPVDFAYAVHSDVGDSTVGAKVNGRLVPLRSSLANGDQVEILRSKQAAPSPTWENFVVSGKARSQIRRFIKNQQRDQYIELGRAILDRAFRQRDRKLSDKAFADAIKIFKLKTADDLFEQVGNGVLMSHKVLDVVFPGEKIPAVKDKVVSLTRPRKGKKTQADGVSMRGLIPGMALHYARCCHPLPGDRVVGIVTTGRGVTIHTIDCEALEQFSDTPERWLDVAWDAEAGGEQTFVGRINAIIGNEPGALSTLSGVIARNRGNITNLKITSRSTDFFEMIFDIEVKDVRHLTHIIAALRADPSVSSVERARG